MAEVVSPSKQLKELQSRYKQCLTDFMQEHKVTTTEFVYTWPDGREEVRYRRPYGSSMAKVLIKEVDNLQKQHEDSPYSYRHV